MLVPCNAAAAAAVTPPGTQTLYGTQLAVVPVQPRIASTMRSDRKSPIPIVVLVVRPNRKDALYDQLSLIEPSAPATMRHWAISVSLWRGGPSTFRSSAERTRGASPGLFQPGAPPQPPARPE